MNETCEIRLATEADAEDMLAIYTPVVLETAISFELEPPSVDEFRSRIRSTLTRTPWLVCEINGEVAGYAYAGPLRTRAAYQWSVEVTVYVHADYRRHGVGSAVYTSLFSCLRHQGLLERIRSHHTPKRWQRRSARANGFLPALAPTTMSATSSGPGMTLGGGNWSWRRCRMSLLSQSCCPTCRKQPSFASAFLRVLPSSGCKFTTPTSGWH